MSIFIPFSFCAIYSTLSTGRWRRRYETKERTDHRPVLQGLPPGAGRHPEKDGAAGHPQPAGLPAQDGGGWLRGTGGYGGVQGPGLPAARQLQQPQPDRPARQLHRQPLCRRPGGPARAVRRSLGRRERGPFQAVKIVSLYQEGST